MLRSSSVYIPPETGTAVIRPNVTNMLYVTAALNCIRTWKTAIKINYGDKSLRHNKCRRSGGWKRSPTEEQEARREQQVPGYALRGEAFRASQVESQHYGPQQQGVEEAEGGEYEGDLAHRRIAHHLAEHNL